MEKIPLESLEEKVSVAIKKALIGEEVVFVEGEQPVAKVEPLPGRKKALKFGSAKGTILYMAEDFDDTSEDFKDYI